MRRFLKLLFLTSLVFGCLSTQQAGHAANRDRHVIVVCIDGLAAFLLDDPKAPIPTARLLARNGTIAENGMKVSNPSVTWPNHTSIVTGVRPEKHGVLANGVLVRGAVGLPTTVDPKRDQKDLVRAATIFDAAHAAGLTTGEINWPCTRGSKTLGDSFSDVPEQVVHMTPRLRTELVEKGILIDETQASFAANSVVGRDLVWTDATCHVIRTRKPNLLFVHLLNCDATHHALGAQTPAGYTANAYADACLAKIVAATKESGIFEKTTFILVADHGFTTTPKAIRPNVILRQQGLLSTTAGKISDARAHVFPEGGIGLIYCTDPAQAPADREKVKELLSGQEGVAEILFPERFAEYGLPHPREYNQAPDAVLVAKDGYAVSGSAEGETFVTTNIEAKTSLGSHGFISTMPKMNAICVLSGNSIQPGIKLPDVENIDLAPTIAQLLGIQNFPADGKVLSKAIRE
ncbi:alkaline phosphatase family protein [Anatilimnocola sp. NA78]|uniref:alkaline phosphatase family protein n=1 Tax=Anatilimnocola sp. NA78 TaxID=3415683 RepID=UPI003CE4F603